MFKWIDKSCVESDAGFVLQFTGRFTFEYREKEIIVSGEFEFGGVQADGIRTVLVSSTSLKLAPGEILPQEERLRIIQNISDAMDFQNLRLVLDPEGLDVSELLKLSPKIKLVE
jgi:hypothetical protein